MPVKEIAADSCCDTRGTHNGAFNTTGMTNSSTSGLPFTQTWLCRLVADTAGFSVPFGALSFFDSSAPSCPAQWAAYNLSAGRAVIPGYIGTGDEPILSVYPPLAPSEDRTHSHDFSTFVQV